MGPYFGCHKIYKFPSDHLGFRDKYSKEFKDVMSLIDKLAVCSQRKVRDFSKGNQFVVFSEFQREKSKPVMYYDYPQDGKPNPYPYLMKIIFLIVYHIFLNIKRK